MPQNTNLKKYSELVNGAYFWRKDDPFMWLKSDPIYAITLYPSI